MTTDDGRTADQDVAIVHGARIVRVDPRAPDRSVLARAGRLLRDGGLVAFPTETVYGLGANALDDAAVRRVFAAKNRDPDDPLIVHLASADQLDTVAAVVTPVARLLADRFWPGPLTLVLPKRPEIPASATAGLPTVGIRVPDHAVARGLIAAAGVPVVAPSANTFTRTSPTLATHVAEDLDGRVDLILDGGPTDLGIESTVLDVSGDQPRLLRPGAATAEAIRAILATLRPPLELTVGARGRAASPGLMKKHYAPRARLLYFRGAAERTRAAMRAAIQDELAAGRRVGLLLYHEDAPALADLVQQIETYDLGRSSDPGQVARRLYAGMRQLDRSGVDTIVVRDLGTAGLGHAIADRLLRAANHQVIDVDAQ